MKHYIGQVSILRQDDDNGDFTATESFLFTADRISNASVMIEAIAREYYSEYNSDTDEESLGVKTEHYGYYFSELGVHVKPCDSLEISEDMFNELKPILPLLESENYNII
jgi:hypothetical protein